MKVVVLGSSSSGNSTYIEINNIKFLIDVGFSHQYIIDKLNDINIKESDLDFIIITHAHSDHVMSLYTFYRSKIPVYLGSNTFNELKIKDKLTNANFIDEIDSIMGIKLIKIPISHDACGFGYVFEYENDSLVYIADTGFIYSKYFDKLKNKKVYLLESNHDVEMEMNGSKDFYTKMRNIGDTGHLSNEDCAKYLSSFVGPKTKHIFLIHISEHDNTYEEAYKVNREAIDKNIDITITHKDNASKMLEI